MPTWSARRCCRAPHGSEEGAICESGNSQGGDRRRRRHGARHRAGVRSGWLRRAAVRHGRGSRGASARRGTRRPLAGRGQGTADSGGRRRNAGTHPPATELAQLGGCDLVVEAIVEQIEPKQQLFRSLEAIVSPDCILATNTSSLSVTAIAAACAHPQRVAGWHFFNPVPRMRLVEIVQAPRTSDPCRRVAGELSKRIGHRAVVTSDTPGFVVNHAGRAFVTEGLKLLAEQCGRALGAGCDPAQLRRLSHGPVRAAGPDRIGRLGASDGIHPHAVLRRRSVPAGCAGAHAHGGGSAGAQEQGRLLPLRRQCRAKSGGTAAAATDPPGPTSGGLRRCLCTAPEIAALLPPRAAPPTQA
jgi:hypothetical protein